MKKYFVLVGLACCPVVSHSQAKDDYVSSKGLTQTQVKVMTDHPDPTLLHNLATRNFNAISDERWSRYNQYQIVRFVSDVGKLHPDGSCMLSLKQNDPLVRDLLKVDVSYFLREPSGSTPTNDNLDSAYLLFGRKDANYAALSSMLDANGCPNLEARRIISSFVNLYAERSVHVVQSAGDPPALPTAKDVPPLRPVGNDPVGWEAAAMVLLREHSTDQVVAEMRMTLNQFTMANRRQDKVGMSQIASAMERAAQGSASSCKMIGVSSDQTCIDAKLYQQIYDRMVEASGGR